MTSSVCNVILVDEIYNNHNLNELLKMYTSYAGLSQIFTAIVNGSSMDIAGGNDMTTDQPSVIPTESSNRFNIPSVYRIYLRNLYRNPLQISRLCSKLRRQLDETYEQQDCLQCLPWAMSVDNGIDVINGRNAIHFASQQEFNVDIRIQEMQVSTKKNAVLCIEYKPEWLNFDEIFFVDNLDNAKAETLNFTGIERTSLLILINKIGEDNLRREKVKLVLYNAFSRVTDSVDVIYDELDSVFFEGLKSYSEIDSVMEKLSQSIILGEDDLKYIESERASMHAIATVIVKKDVKQFENLLPLLKKYSHSQQFCRFVHELLATCFPWCEKGSILEMFEVFQSQTGTQLTRDDVWRILSRSVAFVSKAWDNKTRRRLFSDFKKVAEEQIGKLTVDSDTNSGLIAHNCWIADDDILLPSLHKYLNNDYSVFLKFLKSIGKYHLSPNCFKSTLEIFLESWKRGSTNISVDVFRRAWHLTKENFCFCLEVFTDDVVEVFIGKNGIAKRGKLIFEYALQAPFAIFEQIFSLLMSKSSNIHWNLILDQNGRNVLFYFWNDPAKTQLILQSTYKQSIGDCKELLERKDATGCTFLRHACSRGYNSSLLKVILDYAAAVGTDWSKDLDDIGDTLLHSACRSNDIATFVLLFELDRKSKFTVIKKTNSQGKNCLHYACGNSSETMVKVLMENVPELMNEEVFQKAFTRRNWRLLQIFVQYKFLSSVSENYFFSDQNFLQQRYSEFLTTSDEWHVNALHLACIADKTLQTWIDGPDNKMTRILKNLKENSVCVAYEKGTLDLAESFLQLQSRFLWKK